MCGGEKWNENGKWYLSSSSKWAWWRSDGVWRSRETNSNGGNEEEILKKKSEKAAKSESEESGIPDDIEKLSNYW